MLLASLVDTFFPVRKDSNFGDDRRKWRTIYIAIVQAISWRGKRFSQSCGKSVTKLVSKKDAKGKLFRLVVYITGAKNAIKGVGLFLGGVMLVTVGYFVGLICLSVLILVPIPFVLYYVDRNLGISRKRIKFVDMFKTTKSVGILSLSRFWLYGSRDLWFEIATPIFLAKALGWSPAVVSGLMGIYTIIYGKLQAASNVLCLTPKVYTTPPIKCLAVDDNSGVVSAIGGIAFLLL